SGNAGPIVEGFWNESIDLLISRFEEMGMQLMLPEEYLDTDEKKNAYQSFDLKHSAFNSIVNSLLVDKFKGNSVYATMDGFKIVNVDAEPFVNYNQVGVFKSGNAGKMNMSANYQMAKIGVEISSINDLTEALGVDAVVMVYSTVFAHKKGIYLQNVNLHMYGKNPVPLAAGKESKFNYFPGQMYFGGRVNPTSLIYSPNPKKPETLKFDFTGYSNIMMAITNRFEEYFNKAFEKK
ncbi:MAG: hypothetical protein HRT61_08710, partial [Ekhidna sp.]|nr:hypothetical protein [Ekhidna sp.]